MGEIADMMIEGQMCRWCGQILGDGDGFPVICAGCQSQHNVNEFGEKRSKAENRRRHPNNPKRPRTVICGIGTCDRMFPDEYARDQHRHDKHGSES